MREATPAFVKLLLSQNHGPENKTRSVHWYNPKCHIATVWSENKRLTWGTEKATLAHQMCLNICVLKEDLFTRRTWTRYIHHLLEIWRSLPKLTCLFNLDCTEPSRQLASLHSCWQVEEDGAGDKSRRVIIPLGNMQCLKTDVDLEISFGTCQRLLWCS